MMSESMEWLDQIEMKVWDPVYMGQDEFTAFLEKTNEEYKSILAEIGYLKQQ